MHAKGLGGANIIDAGGAAPATKESIEAVELSMDDEEGELELDMSPLMGGVMVLLRTLVTSRTYRQSSVFAPGAAVRDPENRLLARGPRFRLPARQQGFVDLGTQCR